MSLLKEELELKAQEMGYGLQQELDQFPRWKKWLLALITLAVIPSYIAAKKTSYNNWLKKYSGLVVTAKSSFDNPKDLAPTPVQLVFNGNGTYSAVFSVTNENLDLSAHDVPIEVNFYNSQDEQVGTPFQDKIFLLPNSTKYVVITRIPSGQIAKANIILPPRINWQRRLFVPAVNLVTSSAQVKEDPNTGGTAITVSVKNLSPYDIGAVRVVYLVYDKDRQLIAASQRDEFNITTNSVRDFVQTWPNLSFPKDATVKTVVETNPLDVKNLIVPKGSTAGPASDLSRPETNPQY